MPVGWLGGNAATRDATGSPRGISFDAVSDVGEGFALVVVLAHEHAETGPRFGQSVVPTYDGAA